MSLESLTWPEGVTVEAWVQEGEEGVLGSGVCGLIGGGVRTVVSGIEMGALPTEDMGAEEDATSWFWTVGRT